MRDIDYIGIGRVASYSNLFLNVCHLPVVVETCFQVFDDARVCVQAFADY